MKNLLSKVLFLTLILPILSVLGSQAAYASTTLYLSPASKSVSQGATFNIQVRENSGSDGVNAVQANLTYPSDKMDFLSIAPGAAFEVQAENSGGGGNVRIARGTITPKTGDQLVATVSFKAKVSSGTGAISFAAGSEVDSNGTTVQSGGTSGATITFTAAPTPKPSEPAKDTTAPKIVVTPTVSDLTTTTATVKWQTDEASSSIVDWGPTTAYGTTSQGETSTTNHLVKLDSSLLAAGLTYHYHVKSTDGAGNTVTSGDLAFKLPGYTVKLKIVGALGQPLAKAGVSIAGISGVTAENGTVEIDNVPAGSQTVIVTYRGNTTSSKINVSAKDIPQDFVVSGVNATQRALNSALIIAIIGLVITEIALILIFRRRLPFFKKNSES